MPVLAPVFAAEPTPWYQDFAFWGTFVSVVGILAGAAWALAWRFFRHRIGAERGRFRQELRDAADELEALRPAPVTEIDALNEQLDEARRDAARLRAELTASRDDAARHQKVIDGLNHNLRVARQMEGLTWRARPTGGPAF